MLIQKEEIEKFELKMEETREQFLKEIEDKKNLWEKKQAEIELNYADTKEKLEKERKREEEEYQYALEFTRHQNTQAYKPKKSS